MTGVDNKRLMVAEPPCRIEMFGGLRVTLAGKEISHFRTRKTGVLLAFLACQPGKSASREQLVGQFFPDLDQKAARNNLSQLTSFLRKQLTITGTPMTDILSVDRYTIGLVQSCVSTDVIDFTECLRKAELGNLDIERTQALLDAVEVYRGPLLPDLDEDWANALRSQFSEQHIQALRLTVRLLLKSGDATRALKYASLALNADPLREESHRDLVRLYLALGRPSAALKQYRELAEMLRTEFALAPAASSRKLLVEIQNAAPVDNTPPNSDIEDRSSRTINTSNMAGTSETGGDPTDEGHIIHARPPSSGTVTLMLVDICGLDDEVRTGISATVKRNGGGVLRISGATVSAAFSRASDALQCALGIQSGNSTGRESADGTQISGIRIGLDTCEIRLKEGEAPAQLLQPATRLLAASHPGQVVCTASTAALIERDNLTSVVLLDLGIYRMNASASAERVFCITGPGSEHHYPPLNAQPGWSNQLPINRTRFVGRKVELNRLCKLVADQQVQVITLIGPGGVGKTRLAQEIAHVLIDELHGAIWWVSLADLTQSEMLPERIRESLSITPRAGATPVQQASEVLNERSSILILDNFEQLVEHGAPWVEELLELAPRCTFIITSRHALRIQGEYLLPVNPLSVSQSVDSSAHTTDITYRDEGERQVDLQVLLQIPAIGLFVERVQSVRADFLLTQRNAEDVVEICRTLEGIPLALELAAGRTQALSLKQVRIQLRERFDLLVSRKRHVDQRHRTLWDALDWSYALLPPLLQRLLTRLSMFRAGWTIDAAIAVAVDCDQSSMTAQTEMLDHLEQLMECSLIIGEDHEEGMRFRMLETLREFGQIQLQNGGNLQTMRERMFSWARTVVESVDVQSSDADRQSWLLHIGREYGNIESALEWCTAEASDAELGLKLSAGLWRFWRIRGRYTEGRSHLKRALQRPGAETWSAARMRALYCLGELTCRQGDLAEAKAWCKESLSIARQLGDAHTTASSLCELGEILRCRGDLAAATLYIEESLTISRSAGDMTLVSSSLSMLGNIAKGTGDLARAISLYSESLMVTEQLNDRRSMSSLLNNLGDVARVQGEYKKAENLYSQGLSITREFGDLGGVAYSLNEMGYVQYLQANYSLATTYYEESLAISMEMDNTSGIAWSLANLGTVAAEQGQYAAAKGKFQESLTLFNRVGDKGAIEYAQAGLEKCVQAAVQRSGATG